MGVLAKMVGKDNSPQLPATPLLPAKPLSQRFAAAHDEVAQLEEKLAQAIAWGQEQANGRKIEQGLNDELRAENVHLKNAYDQMLHENTQMATMLNVVGDIVEKLKQVRALKVPADEPHPLSEQMQRAAEKAVILAAGQGQEE